MLIKQVSRVCLLWVSVVIRKGADDEVIYPKEKKRVEKMALIQEHNYRH